MMDNYPLRKRDENEIYRLEFQNRVWLKDTMHAIQLAKAREWNRALDLGCGPGYMSLEIAKLLAPDGIIYSLDNSSLFHQYLKKMVSDLALESINPIQSDIRSSFAFAEDDIDFVFCRWVLMFLDSPREIIQKIHRCLGNHGTFLSMEYLNFHSMSLWPQSTYFEQVYDGVFKLIKSKGGHPDLGSRMPELLSSEGFEILHCFPILKIGRPGSAVWDWVEQNNQNHINLVEEGIISLETLDRFLEDWNEHAQLPYAYLTHPIIMVTIAQKIV